MLADRRKIRCDGAQPSCYTCTRLQRKCEYERVSEHDNLLSRERKRLSRERKAARLAASAPAHGGGDAAADEKAAAAAAALPQVHLPFAAKAASPNFTIPMSQIGAPAQAAPTDIPTAIMHSAPAPEATISPAWATTQGNPAKDLGAWIVPPPLTSPDPGLAHTMSPQQDSLLSLRSTADPSLLELSTPPTTLSTDSPSLMSVPWAEGAGGSRSSLSPTDTASAGAVSSLADFGQSVSGLSLNSLESEATVVEPHELNTALDTPLKLFSDTQLPPSTMANTPSSVDTNTLSDGGSSVFGAPMSINFSPLSPQLAPAAFEGLEPGMDQRPLSGLDENDPSLGLYSTSLPANDPPLALGGAELEPSSLPALHSWTQLAPSNA